MLRVFSTPRRLQKAGNAPEEYEDAYYPVRCGEYAGARVRFAVADGATEGMLSGQWAELLTKVFTRHWHSPDRTPLWLARAYHDWARIKREYIYRRELQNRPIQWYEEPGLEAGAFAALLGVSLTRSNSAQAGAFQAIALGDSCLFQIRNDELLLQFPLAHAEDLNDRPLLISSNPARNREVTRNFKSVCGTFETGDCFYLLTDAVAGWFMREHQAGGTPWRVLEKMVSDSQTFAEWIEMLRQNRQIRNDDVTCLCLQVD